MGNTESNDKWAHIVQITLNRYTYFKNEPIQGEVKLTLDKPLSLTDIVVSIHLDDFWQFQIGKNRYHNTLKTPLVSLNLQIGQVLKKSEPLITLVAGNYSFPFTLNLPQDVQPSFLLQTTLCYHHLRHIVLAELINPGEPMAIRNIFILKSFSSDLNLLSLNKTANVFQCGMCSKGETTITANLQSNNYKYNDIIPITVTIDNSKGMIKVKECQIQLLRKIDFKFNVDKKLRAFHVFYKKEFPFICKEGEKRTESFNIPVLFENQKPGLTTIKPYPYEIDPTELWPSLTTPIFDCYYLIEATVYFDSVVYESSRPKVSFPIWICHSTNNIIPQETQIGNAKILENKAK